MAGTQTLGLSQTTSAGVPEWSLSFHSHQLQLRLNNKKTQTPENSDRMHFIEGNDTTNKYFRKRVVQVSPREAG